MPGERIVLDFVGDLLHEGGLRQFDDTEAALLQQRIDAHIEARKL